MKMFFNYLLITVRSFNTCSVLRNDVRIMRKIMGTNKKKHRFSATPLLPSVTAISKGAFEGKSSINTRRVAVLNKVFMRYITDLMMTNECASALEGYNVEIQGVQVTPDFQCINVYWLAKGNEDDAKIEKILQANSGLLRHELSQLKVIGLVPIIKFVKDKKMAQIMEVDLQLAKADFGDDYVPTEPAARLKSQLQLYTKLGSPIQRQIRAIDEKIGDEVQEDYQNLPKMSHNIFGFDHAAAMNKLCKSMTKSINEDDLKLTAATVVQHEINQYPISTNREEFKEFLFKRQLLKKKLQNTEEKNFRPELDYLKEEFERSIDTQRNPQHEDFVNDDYIDNDEIK